MSIRRIKDEAQTEQECARRHFAAPDEPILMHLSNFRPVKRVADVVKVFARVARERPAQLVLVGDGPDRSPPNGWRTISAFTAACISSASRSA